MTIYYRSGNMLSLYMNVWVQIPLIVNLISNLTKYIVNKKKKRVEVPPPSFNPQIENKTLKQYAKLKVCSYF